jgi:hypothetical protein
MALIFGQKKILVMTRARAFSMRFHKCIGGTSIRSFKWLISVTSFGHFVTYCELTVATKPITNERCINCTGLGYMIILWLIDTRHMREKWFSDYFNTSYPEDGLVETDV